LARTPLLSHLSRALRTIRKARTAGVPVLEYAEAEAERREQGLSRRGFLAGSAGAAAALTLPLGLGLSASGCGGDGGTGKDTDVAIVGGGIAGLHCAHRLRKIGIRPRLYDAQTRLGGRMLSDRITFATPDAQLCELGGELIDTGHMTMRDLATELQLALDDFDTDDGTLDKVVAYIGGRKLTSAEILTGFAPIAMKIDQALATLTDQDDLFVYYDKPNGGQALDALSIKGWLDSISATGPVRTLLEVAYNIEYGLEVEQQNCLNMLFLISTDTAKLDLFGDSDERYHTKLGNDSYITKLAAGLDPAAVFMDHKLTRIAPRSGGGYTLTFMQGATPVEATAAHVVLALPFSILREVEVLVDLPAAKKKAIAEVGYGTNSKLMAGFSSRPWRTTHRSNGETFTDLPFQATWETSRLQAGSSGIITNFTGGLRGVSIGDGTPDAQLATFLGQFDMVFPGAMAAGNGKVARFHWPTHPFVKGSYTAYKPGQYTAFAGAEIERVGNLHFCGEHTSLDAQGYMEGGALTGAMAADEIADDAGLASASQSSRAAWSPSAAADPVAAEARIMSRARLARARRRWLRGALVR